VSTDESKLYTSVTAHLTGGDGEPALGVPAHGQMVSWWFPQDGADPQLREAETCCRWLCSLGDSVRPSDRGSCQVSAAAVTVSTSGGLFSRAVFSRGSGRTSSKSRLGRPCQPWGRLFLAFSSAGGWWFCICSCPYDLCHHCFHIISCGCLTFPPPRLSHYGHLPLYLGFTQLIPLSKSSLTFLLYKEHFLFPHKITLTGLGWGHIFWEGGTGTQSGERT
jgi:hypothetical protein